MGEPQPRVAVVDLKNHFLRWEDRRVVHRDQLFHRSIHILLFDHSGRLVLQRRHPTKLTFPDHWDLSCSGHVEENDYLAGPDERLDEVYAGCAGRELMEELGVVAPLEPLGEFKPIVDVHYECLALYRATSDGPYVAQPDEVAEIRAVTVAEYDALSASGAPCTPTLRWFVDLARAEGWFRDRGQ
jgi:isopentenyl-diphosphate Delta-isomerase